MKAIRIKVITPHTDTFLAGILPMEHVPWIVATLVVALMLVAWPCVATPVALVHDGKSAYCIVVSGEARPVVRNAANVLQEHLDKVTGVKLPIEVLGTDRALPGKAIVVDDGPLAEKAGVDLSAENLKYDGFIVRVINDRLILTGAAERGALYAVMDFLEREVGCRWFSKQRTVIRTRQNLTVTVANRREEPAFQIRILHGIDMWHAASRITSTPKGWGSNPIASDGNAHSFYPRKDIGLVPPATYFKDHPDWYSNHNGVWFHETGQLNYQNPKLIEHVRDTVIKAFKTWGKRWPNLNVSQNDWLGWSEDPVTNAFDAADGTTAASHVQFINQIAEAVAKEAPDRRIITLAYLYTLIPPRTLRYAPNVTALVCEPDAMWGRAVTRCGPLGRRFLKNLKTWASKCDLPAMWVYHQFCVPKYVISPDVAGLQDDIKAYRAAGIKGFTAEVYGYMGTPFDELRPYLMSKLAWNPDLDLNALLRDFHDGYYGKKAGPKMLEFYHAVCDGLDTFEPETYSDERLNRMERTLLEARPLAEDDFARRRIDEALRGVTYTRLAKLIGHWDVKDGFLKNRAAAPEAEALREQFNKLSERIGDEDRLPPRDGLFNEAVVEPANDDLKLTVVPGCGATVARIIDRKTGTDYAFIYPIRSGKIVGGYQELIGYRWGVGIFARFTVKSKTGRSVTMDSDVIKPGLKLERTISVPPSGTTFEVISRMTNVSEGAISKGFRTHPMFRIGRVEDCYFVYRTGTGKIVAKPLQPLECLSADWGPTGLWALINVKTNTGVQWDSSPVHNGHYTWASPGQSSFACETFSEHRELKPGEKLEMRQRFTILRDARQWCVRHNVTLPFDRRGTSVGAYADDAPRVSLRPLSKAEKWHRKNGLFFSGWMSVPLTPEVLAHYKTLYPHAFTTMRGDAGTRKILEKAGMPWIELNERGPCFNGKGFDRRQLPDLPRKHEIGYCVDEDVLWKRDIPTGRVQANTNNLRIYNEIHPDALYVIGCHAWNRAYGCTQLAHTIKPDVVAGEVYPFINGNSGYSSYFWQLTWAREAARKTARAYWVFTQTFGKDGGPKGHCRPPSPSEQRLQVFAALAWGYTGFIDYYYALPAEYYERGSVPFLVDTESNPRPAYEIQKQIIREAMNLGRGLSQLRNIDVGFHGDAPRVLRGLPVSIAPAHVTLGRFMDDNGSDTYFMITNTRTGKDLTVDAGTQEITLSIDSPRLLIELDRMTGKLLTHKPAPLHDRSGRRQYKFKLPGGTGALFKLDDGRPFALLSPLSQSSQSSAGPAKGARGDF